MKPLPIISKTFVLFLVLSSFTYADISPKSVAACPITVGNAPTNQDWDLFKFGGEVLSVYLYSDGWWHGMGPESNYRNRLWWRSAGYDGLTDATPILKVSGRRLDAEADPAQMVTVTNARSKTGNWSMLTLIEFPSVGCWQITGEYGGQVLVFVVLVGEHEHAEASDT